MQSSSFCCFTCKQTRKIGRTKRTLHRRGRVLTKNTRDKNIFGTFASALFVLHRGLLCNLNLNILNHHASRHPIFCSTPHNQKYGQWIYNHSVSIHHHETLFFSFWHSTMMVRSVRFFLVLCQGPEWARGANEDKTFFAWGMLLQADSVDRYTTISNKLLKPALCFAFSCVLDHDCCCCWWW